MSDELPAVVCGDLFYDCVCYKAIHGDDAHVCRCGGSWEQDGTIVALPDIAAGFGAFPNPETVR